MISYKELLIFEQAYAGNLGMMEMMLFYNKATEEQKKKLESLIKSKKNVEAWDLIKSVTNVNLEKV